MRRVHVILSLFAMVCFFSVSSMALNSEAIVFTEEEQEFIKTHPTIRLGIDPEFMPFEYLDINENYTGITAEYLELISERTGITFEIVEGLTWPEAYDAALNKEIDVLPALSKTVQREEFFLFSNPYYNFKRVLVTQSDNQDIKKIEDLAEHTVATQRNSSHHSYLMEQGEVNLSLYESVETALTSVASGNEEVYVGNLATTNYIIHSNGLTNLRYITFETEKPLGLHLGIRNDWPQLQSIINKGLDSISESERIAIHERWIGVVNAVDYGPFFRIIIGIVFIAFVSLGVSLFWIVRLRKEVKKRERIQKELEKASQVKSSFMARMSHEIRTPLNAIIGLSYILKRKQATAAQKVQLDRITQAANTMLGIVNDLLDFSKIEAGKVEIENMPFNIESVIQNVLSIISYRLQETNVELQLNKSPELPNWFIGDKKRIEQILLNLLNNSAKFTETGHIYVSVEVNKSEEDDMHKLCFYIEDTGIGMTQDQLKHLFKPFMQADASINRRFGGTGLGLSIVKNLVDTMDGTVSVESEEDKGTIFRVELPVKIDEEREKAYRENIKKTNLNHLHTLIISNNEPLNERITSYLKSFGMSCQIMETIVDGKMWIEHKNLYDLVILDYDIDTESVFDFTRNLKSNEKISKVPKIIMLLPVMREDLFEQMERYDVDIGIGKPLIPSVLFNGIIDLYGHNYERTSSQSVTLVEENTHTILLIEDNVTNQLIAGSLLEEAGYTILIASNGEEGVETFQKHKDETSIVLMDLHMPIMNGYEAARAIRSISPDVPIVAMTADMIEGVKEECEEHGMHYFIGKPFEPSQLAKTIHEIINKQDAKRRQASKTSRDLIQPQILNEKEGMKQLGHNKELYQQVLNAFYEENKHFVDYFNKLVTSKQYNQSREMIHKIKGSLGNLGCHEMHQLAKNLQYAFEAKDEEQIHDLTHVFLPKMRQLMVEIEENL